MEARQMLVAAIVFAFICWLAVAALVTSFSPAAATLYAFLALTAMAVGATILPVVYLLHLRFGTAAERPRWWRYIRQSLWVGFLVSFFLWLSSLDAFSFPAAMLSICIVALLEGVALRPSRTEMQSPEAE